jgi:hypothetical protein
MPLNVHRLVAKTARTMAEELWEVYARDNVVYRRMRAEGRVTEKAARLLFVNQVMPKLYEDARQALTTMLAQPDDVVAVSVKNEIAEALILDNPHRANRLVHREAAVVPRHLH